MFQRSVFVLGLAALLAAGGSAAQAQAQDESKQLQQEEAVDYFSKWLNQDVKYIISPEEKELFQKLSTGEEKERFIEQFWSRRDPDPRTSHNEFKEEHYRRIAYANDHFASGYPGWRTDRGRIYILYGPPDSKDATPSGGAYDRPFHEGGGATAVFPFELWFYRHLEGLGSDIEFEFVDKSYTGDYQLALRADEKDVFLNTAGHGMTLAEQIGMANRVDRLSFRGATRELYPMMHHRLKDSPFQRYETYSRAQAAPQLKHPELREAVDVRITFDPLPATVKADYFVLNEQQFLVPLTVELHNRDLTFEPIGGVQRARLEVYGRVTALGGQLAAEFDGDLFSTVKGGDSDQARTGRTLYQKTLVLQGGTRYKLDLVVKDAASGNTAVIQTGLVPPDVGAERLAASSLVLADYIEQLVETPDGEAMFVLGDFKVRPSLSGQFPEGGVLGLYFQLYNVPLDQSTLLPSLRLHYSLKKGDESVLESSEPGGTPGTIYSDGRIVIVKGVPLEGLAAGQYQIEIRVEDLVKQESAKLTRRFEIIPM